MITIAIRFILILILLSGNIPITVENDIEQKLSLIKKYQQEGKKQEEAKCYYDIGYLLWKENQINDAIIYFKKALNINKEINNKNAIRTLSTNIGLLYSQINNNKEALKYFNESLNINKYTGNKTEIINELFNIADIYYQTKNYEKQIELLEEALGYAIELNDTRIIYQCLSNLSTAYEMNGNKYKSSEYAEKAAIVYKKLQDEKLKNLEQQKENIKEQIRVSENNLKNKSDSLNLVLNDYKEIQYKNKLIEQENKIKDLIIKEEKEKARVSRIFLYYSIIAVIVFFLLTFILLYQYRQKKKAFKMLEQQKQEIEKQRDYSNKQRQKMIDSFLYAQRIQSAILPPENTLDKLLGEYFILYQPKDIVSGDFFWVTKRENILIIAVADCTGHGVPGALMSMLGMAFLNEIVNKAVLNKHIRSLHSDEILNELRSYIINSLHQKGSRNEPQDGMDISLIMIDTETHTLEFSGAHNPVYIIRDNNELIELYGDKMPVSFHKKKDIPFTRHNFQLKNSDLIYLFTDGYVDQFGGESARKFLYTNFKNLLISICNEPLNVQKNKLIETYNNWKRNYEQVDDICILGIKYSEQIYKQKEQLYNWSNKKILIAEDIDINYFLLVEALKFTGVNILRAINGKKAIEICQQEKPDLILMDIYMPEMNGFEATQTIKKMNPEIPIIMQTALDSGQQSKLSVNAGADDYISKPIDLKTFLIKIKKYLSE